METHPVPQNISSYQFRLVGDMTLKQFFQVAGGVLVGLLFYSTGLPGIIKWFFIIFSSLVGVALAFLPFEDRPLEKWIFSFLRSVYSPSIFNWKQTPPRLVFAPETPGVPAEENKVPLSDLDQNEASMLSQISQNFQNIINPPQVVSTPVIAPAGNLVMPAVPSIPTIPQTKTVAVPQTNYISVAPAPQPKVIVEETQTPPLPPAPTVADLMNRNPVYNPDLLRVPAQFSPEAAPPNPPTVANTVTGQTLDETGKIIEGAIMEIRDAAGRPVRALKTNKLGHFMVVTPLVNGKYEIITEKDGFTFESVTFEANGNIVPPILIKGKMAEVKI